MIQRELFGDSYVDQYARHGYGFAVPRLLDVTFRNGLQEPVHRWFRLTPSYAPELVRHLIEHLECSPTTSLCDPFLGKGTTLIETKRLGIPSLGVEINPLLKLVSEYSLSWELSAAEIDTRPSELLIDANTQIERFSSHSLDQYLHASDATVPPIHNVFRWWRKEVLRDLLILKSSVMAIPDSAWRGLAWVALASTVLDCANIHRNHPTITFDDYNHRKIHPYIEFAAKVRQVQADLAIVSEGSSHAPATVLQGDSTQLSSLLHAPIDRVITSPPYPNRFSYVHTTRPQLFFLDLVHTATEATEIDLLSIGGTWGKATSNLQKRDVLPFPEIEPILADTIRPLRKAHPLLCNYAVLYFNMMYRHISELALVASPTFRCGYVVGNSRLAGVEVPTDVLLARMFELQRFRVDEILVLRKRGGKKKLYETVVCASR